MELKMGDTWKKVMKILTNKMKIFGKDISKTNF